MALLTIRYDELGTGLSCETLINPLTERVYAITHVPGKPEYIPVTATITGSKGSRKPTGIQPIPVPGQPGLVYACATPEEARRVLEVHDALQA